MSSPFRPSVSDDDDLSDDQELLDKVNAKLKSLKSTYMTDDEDEGKEPHDVLSQLEKTTIHSQETSSYSLSKDGGSEASSISGVSTKKQQQAPSGISSWFRRKPSNASQYSSLRQNYSFQNDRGEIISYRLLVSRTEENQECFNILDIKEQEQIKSGANTLKTLFNEFKENLQSHGANLEDIDWDYWTTAINDYNDMIAKDPARFYKELTKGIPDKLRGLMWQVIMNSKSFGLEDVYTTLMSESSPHEKQIKKDLARTRFISDSSMTDKADTLFNIIKSYSLFDSEVGYTQGMAFIAVPLIMNTSESEAFCMMAKLMKVYGLRELYLPDMPGLHLILYQFERLLEDVSPRLHVHLSRQGIKSSMYASQWFLTMFAYKFPLQIVIRIFDVLVAEGLEASLKFAIALMMKNEETLLQLNFDQLLEFLKDKLFDYYLITEDPDDTVTSGINPFTFANNNTTKDSQNAYRVDELVQDAMKVKIIPAVLKKYEAEHEEIYRLEKEREEEIDSLRAKNAQLMREIRKLEQSYALLNKEHVEVANEMIQGKVNLANLEDENNDLKLEVQQLEQKVKELEEEQIKQLADIEANANADELKEFPLHELRNFKADQALLEEEIKKTMERNLEVMEANRFLEEQLNTLEKQFKESKTELELVREEHEELKKKWGAAKNLFSD